MNDNSYVAASPHKKRRVCSRSGYSRKMGSLQHHIPSSRLPARLFPNHRVFLFSLKNPQTLPCLFKAVPWRLHHIPSKKYSLAHYHYPYLRPNQFGSLIPPSIPYQLAPFQLIFAPSAPPPRHSTLGPVSPIASRDVPQLRSYFPSLDSTPQFKETESKFPLPLYT